MPNYHSKSKTSTVNRCSTMLHLWVSSPTRHSTPSNRQKHVHLTDFDAGEIQIVPGCKYASYNQTRLISTQFTTGCYSQHQTILRRLLPTGIAFHSKMEANVLIFVQRLEDHATFAGSRWELLLYGSSTAACLIQQESLYICCTMSIVKSSWLGLKESLTHKYGPEMNVPSLINYFL